MVQELHVAKVAYVLKLGGFKRYLQHPLVRKKCTYPVESGYKLKQWGRNAVKVQYALLGTVYENEMSNEEKQKHYADHDAKLLAMQKLLALAGFDVENDNVDLTVTDPQ